MLRPAENGTGLDWSARKGTTSTLPSGWASARGATHRARSTGSSQDSGEYMTFMCWGYRSQPRAVARPNYAKRESERKSEPYGQRPG